MNPCSCLPPPQYPDLFAQCPLRLRSGLLLFGPPGSGKTMIAGVAAAECGLNLISIKVGETKMLVTIWLERWKSFHYLIKYSNCIIG